MTRSFRRLLTFRSRSIRSFQLGLDAVPMLYVLDLAGIEVVQELAGFRHVRSKLCRQYVLALLLALGNMPRGLLQVPMQHLAGTTGRDWV